MGLCGELSTRMALGNQIQVKLSHTHSHIHIARTPPRPPTPTRPHEAYAADHTRSLLLHRDPKRQCLAGQWRPVHPWIPLHPLRSSVEAHTHTLARMCTHMNEHSHIHTFLPFSHFLTFSSSLHCSLSFPLSLSLSLNYSQMLDPTLTYGAVLYTIPALPLSYGDATYIFQGLAQSSPCFLPSLEWQGGLDVPYCVGPGPAVVQMNVVRRERERGEWRGREEKGELK